MLQYIFSQSRNCLKIMLTDKYDNYINATSNVVYRDFLKHVKPEL